MGVHTRDGGSSEIMPRIAATLVVLLIVVQAPSFCSARSAAPNVTSKASRRGLSDSTEKPSGMVVDLMSIHHKDSPFAQPNLTLAERVQFALEGHNQVRFNGSKVGAKDVFDVTIENRPYSTFPNTQPIYAMRLNIGTPPGEYWGLVDTGSSIVWIQCQPPAGGGLWNQPDPVYDPKKSSTHGTLACNDDLCQGVFTGCGETCVYGVEYPGDGRGAKTEGDFDTEVLTLKSTDGSTASFALAFGCGHNQNGGFGFGEITYRTDGIVGLGNAPEALVQQLGNGRKSPNGGVNSVPQVFSHCLVNFATNPDITSTLIIGDFDHNLNYQWTPMVSAVVRGEDSPSYYVKLMGITVAGKAVSLPSGIFQLLPNGEGGVILDNGAFGVELLSGAYVPFRDAIKAAIEYPIVPGGVMGRELCYDVTGVEEPQWPLVAYHFEGVPGGPDAHVTQQPFNLFIPNYRPITPPKTIYCLNYREKSMALPLPPSLLDSQWMVDLMIVFDLKNKRIGIPPYPTYCEAYRWPG